MKYKKCITPGNVSVVNKKTKQNIKEDPLIVWKSQCLCLSM